MGLLSKVFLASLVMLAGVQRGHAQLLSPGTEAPYQVVGRAVFEKIPVTSAGLDREALNLQPIREAAVAVTDLSTGALLAILETDGDGRFQHGVASRGPYGIRVLATLPEQGVWVLDNANGSTWSVTATANPGEPTVVRASDDGREAGAFNILEVLRRANAFVRGLAPDLALPELTVYWSPGNTSDPRSTTGQWVGGTWFDPNRNVAVVLGDRSFDSDEFDDNVILHEYAHFLAALFSTDDSRGGPHHPGDVLDPRVAWSEGWANFFSALVEGDPIYRDSYGPSGSQVREYDLESNAPGAEQPGYWSERSVHALLWDLVDEASDSGESIDLDPQVLWDAFTALAESHFVYLPSFLDALGERGSVDAADLQQLARLHYLEYAAGGTDMPGSFPRPLSGNVTTGELDSWSEKRSNLAKSAHLYSFYTGGGAVTIELEITGLGPARNANANDLDLILRDRYGRLLRASNAGRDGQSERIVTFLPQGNYVVEVRSFFGRKGTDGAELRAFNSGAYRLSVIRP